MRVHLIAIGGSAMHNLALALKHAGHEVSGSDDEIFEPSKSRLEAKGLLPESFGWFPEKITTDLDAIILGMHAKPDNPELLKAQELGVTIYSYPEFLYEQSKYKKSLLDCLRQGLMDKFDLVVATKDWHPANHGSFAATHHAYWRKPGDVIDLNGLPQVLWPIHCVQGTFGAEFVNELDDDKIDHITYKGTDVGIDSYSGFFDNGRRKCAGKPSKQRKHREAKASLGPTPLQFPDHGRQQHTQRRECAAGGHKEHQADHCQQQPAARFG